MSCSSSSRTGSWAVSGRVFYAEYALVVLLFGLVAVHGAYFGRLARLASAKREASSDERATDLAGRRRALQCVSFRVSLLSLLASVAVMVLAINAA